MIESTAAARIQRALESQTRQSGQSMDLQMSEFVGALRKTEKKGVSNWIWPSRRIHQLQVARAPDVSTHSGRETSDVPAQS